MSGTNELYVQCPRCKGHRQVYATTHAGSDYFPSRGEWFICPVCYGTGEADRDAARDYIETLAEQD